MCNFQRMAVQKKPRGMNGSKAKEPIPEPMRMMPTRVKTARLARELLQDEVAEKAGVSQTSYSNMETGNSLDGVRLVTAVRVAKTLGLSLDEMVLGIPNLYVQLASALADGRISPTAVVPTERAQALGGPRDSEPAPRPAKKRSPHRR